MSKESIVSITEENEIVIYAEIGYMEGLSQSSTMEIHRQYEATLKSGSRCRVRKTTKDDEVSYTYTLKNSNAEFSNVSGSTEYNIEVDQSLFEGFKEAADRLTKKRRYTFLHNLKIVVGDKSITIKNVKYEVDVFFLLDGRAARELSAKWCKIDIEIDAINEYLEENYPDEDELKFTISVSDLPFKPKNPIMKSTATEEQKAKINELWEHEFSTQLVS